MIATTDLVQIIGISVGAMFALLTLLIGVFVWVINRQDKTNDRRHSETKESVDSLRAETKEEFANVRAETKESIDNLRQETKDEFARVRAETKESIDNLRQETKDEFAKVRAETKQEFANVRAEMAQLFQRQNEENERRHQEVMKAIGLLYQHTHGEDGRMVIPIDSAELVVPPTVPRPCRRLTQRIRHGRMPESGRYGWRPMWAMSLSCRLASSDTATAGPMKPN